MAELNWTEDKWQMLNTAVREEFSKASVSSKFLKPLGPLHGSTENVRNELIRIDVADTPTLSLDADHDTVNRRPVNLRVNVDLSTEQVADEKLANAMLLFRRAGNILAQEEDRIVFAGYRVGFGNEDSGFVGNNVEPQQGLADLPTRRTFQTIPAGGGRNAQGQAVVGVVVGAITTLETNSNPGPFACVLGNALFEAVHTPNNNLVLPADRITPMLMGGPLLRSGQMDPNTGIVVSRAGDTVDVVVATEPTVQFLQRTDNARFLFRVYERFVLRIRDRNQPPMAGFRVGPTAADRAAERNILRANALLREAARR